MNLPLPALFRRCLSACGLRHACLVVVLTLLMARQLPAATAQMVSTLDTPEVVLDAGQLLQTDERTFSCDGLGLVVEPTHITIGFQLSRILPLTPITEAYPLAAWRAAILPNLQSTPAAAFDARSRTFYFTTGLKGTYVLTPVRQNGGTMTVLGCNSLQVKVPNNLLTVVAALFDGNQQLINANPNIKLTSEFGRGPIMLLGEAMLGGNDLFQQLNGGPVSLGSWRVGAFRYDPLDPLIVQMPTPLAIGPANTSGAIYVGVYFYLGPQDTTPVSPHVIYPWIPPIWVDDSAPINDDFSIFAQEPGTGVDHKLDDTGWDFVPGSLLTVQPKYFNPAFLQLRKAKDNSPCPILALGRAAGWYVNKYSDLFGANAGPTNRLRVIVGTYPDFYYVREIEVRAARLGIDVSSDQGSISWTKVKASPPSFVFVRATLGASPAHGGQGEYVDHNLDYNVLKALPVPVGVYHVAFPQKNANPTNEALTFIEQAGKFIGNGFLPPVLDIESTAAPSTGTLSSWVTRWLQYVEEKTKVTPILYANASTMEAFPAALTSSYDQWIAKYDNDPIATPKATDGTTFPDWLFKQYSETGQWSGINVDVDLDSFNGDSTALRDMTYHPSAPTSIVVMNGPDGGPILPPRNGTFTLQVTVPGAQQITMQASSDMIHWIDEATLTTSNGTAIFTDSNANASPGKFYRVKQ